MEIADVSQEGSEEVVGGEGVIAGVVVLFREEAAGLLALLCAIERDAIPPPLDFRALFARVLGPTSSGAPSSTGLSCLRAIVGGSMVGSFGPAMAVGAEDADEVVDWPGPETVINTEDEAEGAARVISGSILPKQEGGRSSRPRRGEGGRLNIGWNPDIGDATGGQASSSSPPLTTSPSRLPSLSSPPFFPPWSAVLLLPPGSSCLLGLFPFAAATNPGTLGAPAETPSALVGLDGPFGTGLMTGIALSDCARFLEGGTLFAGANFFDVTMRLSALFPRVKADPVEGAAEAFLEMEGAATEGAADMEGAATEGVADMEVISDAATDGAEDTEREGRVLTVVESPLSMLSISISPSLRSMVYKDSKPEFSGSARARHSSTPDDFRTLINR